MASGTEIFEALKGLPRSQRELAALQAAHDGTYVAWPLMKIPCGPGSYFLATSDYFSLGNDRDFLRMPLSGPIAQEVADALGMHLMTARMSDRVWVAAKATGIATPPSPMGPPYDASMESFERLAAHEKRVNEILSLGEQSWRGMLIAGHKKDVVISPRMLQRPGWLAFYGWHKPDGSPIQGLNLAAHTSDYADYSHGIRLVAASMVVNGSSMLVADVLADPHLCSMLSGEGIVPPTVRYAHVNKVNPPMTFPSTIKLGSNGDTVVRWQNALNVTADGDFGPKTQEATIAWQEAHGLQGDGVVGPATWTKLLEITDRKTDPAIPAAFPFVQAKHYYPNGMGEVGLVVIHTMEWGETVKTAENCAAMFNGASSPSSSAHYCVDTDSIVQCVREQDGAWHTPGFLAGKEVNRVSIGIEHAGYAKQSVQEWADDYSMSMLRLSAQLVGGICKRYGIPVQRLTKEQLVAGEKGLAGHVDITNATGSGTHWDPGPNFPWDVYLGMVQEYAA